MMKSIGGPVMGDRNMRGLYCIYMVVGEWMY
jgi:hypothetical protein